MDGVTFDDDLSVRKLLQHRGYLVKDVHVLLNQLRVVEVLVIRLERHEMDVAHPDPVAVLYRVVFGHEYSDGNGRFAGRFISDLVGHL